MKERTTNIRTVDGAMETFVTHPQSAGPFPAVIVYMDVWGIREELLDIARRIATTGYYVMVPDLYYRQGRVRHEFRDEKNRMISMEALDDSKKELVRTSMRKLTDAMVVNDTASLLQFIDDGEPVCPGALGAIGYCMGGRHVFRVAGNFPDRFHGCASLHGTRLVTEDGDSPHLTAMKAQGEIYCGFAEKDPYAALPTIKIIADCMQRAPVNYSYELHMGAQHGYALPDRDIYDKQAANRDWELMFALWLRQLPRS